VTLGVEYGFETADKQQWRVAVEYYQQTPTEPIKFGALASQTLLPDWNAIMLRINFSF